MRRVMRARVTWPTEPAHEQNDYHHSESDEHDHHDRTEEPAMPSSGPHVGSVVPAALLLRPRGR